MFRYQIWFLMHLVGDVNINFPYFLLQSLTKMSKKVQKFPKLVESSLLHRSLITMMVVDALEYHTLTFSEFLAESNFSYQPSSTRKKIEKGESSKSVDRERGKKKMETPVVAEVGSNSKLMKPEIKVTYTRSTRAQSKKMKMNKEESIEDDQVRFEGSEEQPFVR